MATRFGAYEILYELKSGGMGAVLLGRRRGPGAFEQLVAIKTIRPEFAQTPAVRAMFLDEAAILARLSHPGIATVHDFGEEGGTLYMVMEYVAGIPFRDLVEHQPPPMIVTRAIIEAARGLQAAHEARDSAGHFMGLVHRDISPDNLMLGYDGHVKVIDFGIALVKNRQAPVTEFGMVKGKPPYMSPEQVKNEAMDRRSDVFSLAVVTWEMLTQKPLFEGDSIYAIAIAVEQQPIEPPSRALGAPLPTGLDAAVMGALDRDLARRTPTAAAFAEQLEQVVQVAGGDTLEAWAERELDKPRTGHRQWLTEIVTGATHARQVGRASGQVTEIGQVGNPVEHAVTMPAIGAPGPAPTPTSIGADDSLDRPPRNKLAPLALLLLALLAGGIALVLVMTSHDAKPPAKPPIDAALATSDVPLIVTPSPLDAYEPPPVVADAAVADAATHHPADARPHRDAAVPMTAPDAAPVPVGSGVVTIRSNTIPPAMISIDGGNSLAPPVNKRKLAAGKHVIRFVDPKNGDTLDTKTIELHDGDNILVTQ